MRIVSQTLHKTPKRFRNAILTYSIYTPRSHKEAIFGLSKALASDVVAVPFPRLTAPATFSQMAFSASVPLSQKVRACTKCIHEEPLRRKEAFQACKRNTKTSRLPFPPSSSCQYHNIHPFSSNTVVTFQVKRCVCAADVKKFWIYLNPQNVSIYTMCKGALSRDKCLTPSWCTELCIPSFSGN